MERLGGGAEENEAAAVEVNDEREVGVWGKIVGFEEPEEGLGFWVERNVLGEDELG